MRYACSCEYNEAKISEKHSRGEPPQNLKAKYFFFRLGGNDGGEGAYTQYVTEADRVSNDV